MRILVFFFLVFGLFSSCLADLRPNKPVEIGKIYIAKQLLRDSAMKHGFEFWVQTQSFSCSIKDQFFGIVGKAANPLDKDEACFDAKYSKEGDNGKSGELIVTKGKFKGERWIFKENESYLNDGHDKLSKNLAKKIEFWVPTYKYFIEFPFRIVEADAIEYLGKETFKDVIYDKVLASWITTAAQSNIDQYIVWISESKEIKRIDYTVRDQYRFISGTAIYDEYIKFEGFDVPKKISVSSSLSGEKIIHQMSFDSYEIIK